jgi:hypothetical protein
MGAAVKRLSLPPSISVLRPDAENAINECAQRTISPGTRTARWDSMRAWLDTP